MGGCRLWAGRDSGGVASVRSEGLQAYSFQKALLNLRRGFHLRHLEMDKNTLQDWKKITRDSYNVYAYDFSSFSSTFRGKKQEWIDHFASQLEKDSRVLDIGCGAGGDAVYLSKTGLNITGIDFSAKLIDIAKKNLPSGNFLVVDFEDLSFEKDSFDGIWAMASLLHVPKQNLPAVLKKIYMVLDPSGLFFSSFRVGNEEKFTIEQRGNARLKRFYSYYQPEEIKKMLQEAGFKNIEQDLDHIVSGDWVAFFCRK